MRPSEAWSARPEAVSFLNEPGRPVRERYMPLRGDCTEPSVLVRRPPRQPTEASTVPGFTWDPVPPFAATTTSVTTERSAHCGRLRVSVTPAHFLPVGSAALR